MLITQQPLIHPATPRGIIIIYKRTGSKYIIGTFKGVHLTLPYSHLKHFLLTHSYAIYIEKGEKRGKCKVKL